MRLWGAKKGISPEGVVTEGSSPLEKLREAYNRGGLSGLGSLLGDYVRWRISGSPPDPAEPIEVRLDRVDASVVVVLMRDFYERTTPAEEPLISVVLPTRERPAALAMAVGSVLEQAYANWELLVINDSANEVEGLPSDERVRLISGNGLGVAAARNRGLDEARGRFVTFLDDDNVMDRLWLKSIALTLDQDPTIEVMIGAQLVTAEPGSAEMTRIRFPARFDWDRLIEGNFVDMAMLAHAAGLWVRFDESLPALVDWDYVVRITLERTPKLVPAVTGIYLTGSSGRISYGDRRAVHRQVRARFRALAEKSSAAGMIVGSADLEALRRMIIRLEEQRGRKIRVLVPDEGDLSEAVREAIEAVAGPMGPAQEGELVDVLIADSAPGADHLASLGADGLVVGLRSHQVDYEEAGMPYFRRLGDHLSLGSRAVFDPESLFDGATLVKLGVDRTT